VRLGRLPAVSFAIGRRPVISQTRGRLGPGTVVTSAIFLAAILGMVVYLVRSHADELAPEPA
jgi:hypothetical protein